VLKTRISAGFADKRMLWWVDRRRAGAPEALLLFPRALGPRASNHQLPKNTVSKLTSSPKWDRTNRSAIFIGEGPYRTSFACCLALCPLGVEVSSELQPATRGPADMQISCPRLQGSRQQMPSHHACLSSTGESRPSLAHSSARARCGNTLARHSGHRASATLLLQWIVAPWAYHSDCHFAPVSMAASRWCYTVWVLCSIHC
jgi:hypothetical protein